VLRVRQQGRPEVTAFESHECDSSSPEVTAAPRKEQGGCDEMHVFQFEAAGCGMEYPQKEERQLAKGDDIQQRMVLIDRC
jgi:hypothetical protein